MITDFISGQNVSKDLDDLEWATDILASSLSWSQPQGRGDGYNGKDHRAEAIQENWLLRVDTKVDDVQTPMK